MFILANEWIHRPADKQDQGNERASVTPLSLSLKAERLFTCFQDVQIGCLVIVDRYVAIWSDHTHESIAPLHDVTIGHLGSSFKGQWDRQDPEQWRSE